jgi:predicted membrane protein DUF2232
VILIACLSTIIAAFSPFWGLIFIFTLGAKYQQEKLFQKFYGIFLLTAVALFLGKAIDVISLTDIVIGVALTSYIYFRLLQRKYDYLSTIISVFLLNVVYGIIRYFLFSAKIQQNISFLAEEFKKLSTEMPVENQSMAQSFTELIEITKYVITNFYPGIWVLTLVLAVYIGSLFLSTRLKHKWQHKLVRLPYETVYPIMICLVAFLFKTTRIIGINGLLMILPLFLIQGLSILDFYWGDHIRKVKILMVLLVLAMVFNPYIVAIIAVLGLTDIWFNFRKIRIREEINENNLN